MVTLASIVELRSRSPIGIYAVPYHNQSRGKPRRLLDGTIVEAPSPDERCEAPTTVEGCFEVAADGSPASVHHANLGLATTLLALEGVYLLSSGEVAAVYGAEAVPIG